MRSPNSSFGMSTSLYSSHNSAATLSPRRVTDSWTGDALSPRVAGDAHSLGRERVKQFTYDYSYWSLDAAAEQYASQQQVPA